MSDYSIEFRTIAAESRWNADSLCDAFYHGLSGIIKNELAARDAPTGLDAESRTRRVCFPGSSSSACHRVHLTSSLRFQRFR